MRPIYRKIVVVIVILMVTGFFKGKWESSLDRRLTGAGLLREAPTNIDWRQQLRQEVLSALLGKLRSIMAIYFTLAGMEDWANKDWPGVQKNFRMATDLDPEDVDLWSFAIWQLETNAASYWILREDLPEPIREAEALQWVVKGLEFSNRALQYHPESSKLLAQSAKIYLDKLKLPCEAAAYYKRARDGDAPLNFLVRFYPYALALCSGSEEEAHKLLMDLYRQGKHQRLPTLIKRIRGLEIKLNIPAAQRITDRDPDEALKERFPHAEIALNKIDLEGDEDAREVHQTFRDLYDRGKEYRFPLLIHLLKLLEEEMKIPLDQRIEDPDPDS